MKRVVVFLVIGPLLVAIASFASLRSDWLFTIDLFLSISTASILVGLVDGYLARVLAVVPRVPLMAAVGAIVAWPLANAFVFTGLGGMLTRTILLKALTPGLLAAFALPSAVYVGVCSLLANDWGDRR